MPAGGLPGAAAGEKLSCAVCLEEFAEGSELRCLPCLHKFHKVGGRDAALCSHTPQTDAQCSCACCVLRPHDRGHPQGQVCALHLLAGPMDLLAVPMERGWSMIAATRPHYYKQNSCTATHRWGACSSIHWCHQMHVHCTLIDSTIHVPTIHVPLSVSCRAALTPGCDRRHLALSATGTAHNWAPHPRWHHPWSS